MRSCALVLLALIAPGCDEETLCGSVQLPDQPVAAAPDASACPSADTGCTSVACSGRCFEICVGSVTHAVASVGCASRGGCLARVDAGDIAVCLGVALASAPQSSAWIGMIQPNGAGSVGAMWKWQCTGTLSTPWWLPGEPNDAAATAGVEDDEEQCTYIVSGNGLMADVGCGVSYQYICEVPP